MIRFILGLFTGIVLCNVTWIGFVEFVNRIINFIGEL